METQIITRIERITLTLDRTEAARALVDPHEVQTALRTALGENSETDSRPVTRRLESARHPRIPVHGNGHVSKGEGDPKAGKGLKGKWARKLPCPECGAKLHRATSTCSRNPHRAASSIPTLAAGSTES